MTAWDYMYKSEFKARAELSAESELVLEVELPPTAPMNGAKIEIKNSRSKPDWFCNCFAPLGCTQHGRIVVVLGIPTHLATYTTCPVSCGRTPANSLQCDACISNSSFPQETERASTSCVVTPLLFVSCTVKGHA